jgi:glycosyltransferase involved in cell wall biosynthesis
MVNTAGKVTIGIPSRNRLHYLTAAMSSVLSQTYQNIEVIVSDDESTDGTWEYLSAIKDPRVRAIRQKSKLGMVPNFNAVLEQATGELFMLLSDDDLLEPTAIEKLSAPFWAGSEGKAASTIGLSWCPYINIDADGRELWGSRGGPAMESPVDLVSGLFSGHRGIIVSGVLVRTADVRSVGGYNNDRHGTCCDAGNWGQVAMHYDYVVCVPERLMRYRMHSSSITGTANCQQWQEWAWNMNEDFATVLRKRGDERGVRRLERVRGSLLAQITVTVLMRYLGQPGWKQLFAREIWAGRNFMFTPFVAKRLAKDGWKLLRLKKA